MKFLFFHFCRSAGLLLLIICSLPSEAAAQGARLDLTRIDHLAEKADETVDVSLDERLLQVASRILNPNNPQEKVVRDLVSGLKGVYVKVYKFERANNYGGGDIEAIRSQLRGPGWSRFVGVRSRRQGENVEVFTWLEGNLISGLAIIAAEPTELVLVNIIGPIDLEKLSQLEGMFGIPRLDLDRTKPRKE